MAEAIDKGKQHTRARARTRAPTHPPTHPHTHTQAQQRMLSMCAVAWDNKARLFEGIPDNQGRA